MKRNDLATQKPWVARPTQPGRDSSWEVAAPPRYGGGPPQAFAVLLSEADARLIAASHSLLDACAAAWGAMPATSADHIAIRTMLYSVIVSTTGQDFDPVAEDEAQARMETKD